MEQNIEELAFSFASGLKLEYDDFYCETRDIFQARLERMTRDLLSNPDFNEDDVYIASAIAGEIGNNSFDHNIGLWIGSAGIFFGYVFHQRSLKMVLADSGQGLYRTLKRVKPSITNDEEALSVAFNEKISGRAPENRGNGLKFVKMSIKDKGMHLTFISGNAKAELNNSEEIVSLDKNYQGCIAIINF